MPSRTSVAFRDLPTWCPDCGSGFGASGFGVFLYAHKPMMWFASCHQNQSPTALQISLTELKRTFESRPSKLSGVCMVFVAAATRSRLREQATILPQTKENLLEILLRTITHQLSRPISENRELTPSFLNILLLCCYSQLKGSEINATDL
jgi:hypothetical protein